MKSEEYYRQLDREHEARMDRMEDDDDDLTRKLCVSRSLACKDMTCGADDCPTCRPGTWKEAAIEEAGGEDDA